MDIKASIWVFTETLDVTKFSAKPRDILDPSHYLCVAIAL